MSSGARSRPGARVRSVIVFLVLCAGFRPTGPAAADTHVPASFDLSGLWVADGPRASESICARLLVCSDLPIMAGRDLMELRAVSHEVALMETPFSRDLPFGGRTKQRAVKVQYAGAYHHFHGHAESSLTDASQRRMRVRHIERITYRLEGTLLFDVEFQGFVFGLTGTAEGPPRYQHNLQIALRTETGALAVTDKRELFADAAGTAINLSYVPFGGAAGSLGLSPGGLEALAEPGPQIAGSVVFPAWVGYRRVAGSLLDVRSSIDGRVKPRLIDATISKATVTLYRQVGIVRPKRDDESETDYARYRRGQLTALKTASVDGSGAFSFDQLSAFERRGYGAARHPERAYYAVGVDHAEIDVDAAVFGQPVVYFQPRIVTNVEVATVHEIGLDGLAEIGIKRGLAERLSAISGQYAAAEGPVEEHLVRLSEGSPSAGEIEGLRRGIWAERLVLESTESVDALLKLMLEGLGDLLGNLIVDLAPKSDRVRESKETLAQMARSGQSVPPDYAWKFPRGLPPFANEHLKGLVEDAAITKIAETLRKLLKSFHIALTRFLHVNGVEDEKAERIAGHMVLAMKTVLSAIETRTYRGGGRDAVAEIIKTYVKEAHGMLFDDLSLPSFTTGARPLLVESVARMRSWDLATDTYFADAAETAARLEEVIEATASATAYVAYAKALGETFDVAQDLFEIFEDVHKGAKALKWLALVAKYLSNAAAFGLPAKVVYDDAPRLMEAGVYRAFGRDPPDGGGQGAALEEAPATAEYNPRLHAAIEDACAALESALGALAADLESDTIAAAIERFALDRPEGLPASLLRARGALGRFLEQALSAAPADAASGSSIDQVAALDLELLAFDVEIRDRFLSFLRKVYAAAYSGPEDPLYIADREHVLALHDGAKALLAKVRSEAARLAARQQSLRFVPLVAVGGIGIVSDAGGESLISASPEEFTLRARIRNLATVAIGGVSARLAIAGADGAFSVLSDPEQPAGGASLAADDGGDGSGPDEVEVEWKLRYAGSLEPGAFQLSIALFENGAEPAGFEALDGETLIAVDPELSDRDLDGLPDDYEAAKGLDAERDDTGEDADGDGVLNGAEHGLGLDPRLADTDGDGLDDGEELDGGADGFRTDPLAADTDGDGVGDADDRQPVDAASSEAGQPFPEPVVALDAEEVVLTKEQPLAAVLVSNAGAGALAWTARAENDAIARTNPEYPELRGEGLLIISAPPRHDFAAAVETRVEVADARGATRDARALRVRLEAAPHPNRPPVLAPGANPRATPGAAAVGESIAFSVDASDPDGDPLSYTWDFRDGSAPQSLPDASVAHAFERSGVFAVLVTVSDGRGGQASGQVSVNVQSGPGTPPLATLTIHRLVAKAKFAVAGKDSCTLAGQLGDFPPGWSPAGAVLVVDVGGVRVPFVLDAKGKARAPFGTLTLKRKLVRGTFPGGPASFTAKLRGSFAAPWLDEGVTPDRDRKLEPASFVVAVEIGGQRVAATVEALLSVKAAKTASAVFKGD